MLCAEWQSLQTGSFLRGVGHPRGMDALGEQLVDAPMALRAGPGDVGAVHGRPRVGGRKLPVGGVAVRAVGRDGEAGLHQSLAVDALQVVFDDVLLGPLVAHGGLLSRAMAPGAERRHVAREGRRVRVGLAERPVGAVAVAALGRVRVAPRKELAVRALAVLLDGRGMTDGAIDFGRHRAARARRVGRVAAGVALDAGDPGVARVRQLVLVREERDRLPRPGPTAVSGRRGSACNPGRPCPACRTPCAPCGASGNPRRPESGAAASPTVPRGSPCGGPSRSGRGSACRCERCSAWRSRSAGRCAAGRSAPCGSWCTRPSRSGRA